MDRPIRDHQFNRSWCISTTPKATNFFYPFQTYTAIKKLVVLGVVNMRQLLLRCLQIITMFDPYAPPVGIPANSTVVYTHSLDSGKKSKIHNNLDFSDTHHGCWCHAERLLWKYICPRIGFCGWVQEFNIEKIGMDDNISDVPKLCYYANKREHWW